MAQDDAQRDKPKTHGPQTPAESPSPMARLRRLLQIDAGASDGRVIEEAAKTLEEAISHYGGDYLDVLWSSKGNQWVSATNGLSSL